MARTESFHFADDKGRAYSDARCEAYRADTKAYIDVQYTDSNGDVTFTTLVTSVDALIYCHHHDKSEMIYNYAPPDLGDCGGDLDDITDGGTYGKVEIGQLTANRITLSGADGNLDDIDNGTYGKVRTIDITDGHVLLGACFGDLSSIDDGNGYGKVALTDLSAGHLKLTSNVVVDGEWYDESGVEIDSATGINIYGTDSALTTRATKTGTIQCKVDASGNISAGAGTVLLNASGITVKGAKLYLQDSAGNNEHNIYIDTDGNLMLDQWSYAKVNGLWLALNILSVSAGVASLGTTGYYFEETMALHAALKETTTPTADAGWGRIYTKNDNKLYFQDGAGTEHEVAYA